MPFYDLKELDAKQLPGYLRRVLTGKNLMLVYVEREAGSVQEHSHPNEQMVYLLEGRGRFRVGGEEREVEAGQVAHIPADVPHRLEALTPVRYLGIYSPPREEIRPENA